MILSKFLVFRNALQKGVCFSQMFLCKTPPEQFGCLLLEGIRWKSGVWAYINYSSNRPPCKNSWLHSADLSLSSLQVHIQRLTAPQGFLWTCLASTGVGGGVPSSPGVAWRSQKQDRVGFGLWSLNLGWVSTTCLYHAASIGWECVLWSREPSPRETHCTLLDEQNVRVC